MQPINKAGLEVVFRNPEPRRELQHPDTWLLLTESQALKVFVAQDGGRHPRVIRKEAA